MIVFVLSNCEVKVKESNAYNKQSTLIINKKGMNYFVIATSDSYQAGITVVNLTKDSLEVEYYKKMLKQ
jgi:hypothetical protein